MCDESELFVGQGGAALYVPGGKRSVGMETKGLLRGCTAIRLVSGLGSIAR